jgi:hypothetical protein
MGHHVGPQPSCASTSTSGAAHYVEAELTPRCAILHRVAGREHSMPAAALPLATAGPSSPLTSPLSPVQLTAHRTASSPAMCASPPRHSLMLSLRATEAPHCRRLLLTSVWPPHLLPMCCLPSTHAAIAGAVLCCHAARAHVHVPWAALYHGPRSGKQPVALVPFSIS